MNIAIIEALKLTKGLLSLSGRLDDETLKRNGMKPRDDRPVRPGPTANFKFGLGVGILLSIIIWVIFLLLALAVNKALGANTENRFLFPDTTKGVELLWSRNRSGGAPRGYHVRVVRSGNLNILQLEAADTSMIFNFEDLKDSSSFEVSAWNNKGFSAYTFPIWAISVKGGIPPVTPPTSEFPFSDSGFTFAVNNTKVYHDVWSMVGGGGWSDRPYEFGTGLYMWNGAVISRIFDLPAGTISFNVEGCGYSDKDSIEVSVDAMKKSVILGKGTPRQATTFIHQVPFQIATSGPYIIKIKACNNVMIKPMSGSIEGEDMLAPGIPLYPMLRKL